MKFSARFFFIKIYLSHFIFEKPDIGLGVRVFANGPGDLGSIPGRVIPKTQKMVLDASLLNTQHYKVWIKGKVEQSREGVAPSPTHCCSSYWKGSLRVTLDYGRQLYLLYLLHKYLHWSFFWKLLLFSYYILLPFHILIHLWRCANIQGRFLQFSLISLGKEERACLWCLLRFKFISDIFMVEEGMSDMVVFWICYRCFCFQSLKDFISFSFSWKRFLYFGLNFLLCLVY